MTTVASLDEREARALVQTSLARLERALGDLSRTIDVVINDLRRAREWRPADAIRRGGQARPLETRLRAVHACATAPCGFEQLPPERGERRWQCLGCGAIVTLRGRPRP